MKTINIILTLLTSLSVGDYAMAGGAEGGGGGDAVVCFQNQADKQKVEQVILNNRKKHVSDDPLEGINLATISVHMLDLWQVKKTGIHNTTDTIISSTDSADKIVQERLYLLNLITKFSETVDTLLGGRFSEDKWIQSEHGVLEIDDSNHKQIFGSQCLLLQIGYYDGSAVVYDRRLYERMNSVHQAAFIFHEVLYFVGRGMNHRDSVPTRYFVGKLFSKDFKSLSGKEVSDYLALIKYDILDSEFFDTVTIGANTFRFKQGTYSHADLSGVLWSPAEVGGVPVDNEYTTRFFSNGNLKAGTLSEKFLFGNQVVRAGVGVELNGTGQLVRAYAPVDGYFVRFGGVKAGTVLLWPNGEFRGGTLRSTATFKKRGIFSNEVLCKEGFHFEVDLEGYITRCGDEIYE